MKAETEAAFAWKGGAVRLVEPVADPIIRAQEWGHLEKDEYTVPFGPWSLAKEDMGRTPPVSAGPWVWRYGTASAGTGSRYSALATRVHADVGAREGNIVIVTLLSPWKAAYALAEEGYLHESYVAEKFGVGRALHEGDLTAVTLLIRTLLGRTEA